jgi:hypothetical protein
MGADAKVGVARTMGEDHSSAAVSLATTISETVQQQPLGLFLSLPRRPISLTVGACPKRHYISSVMSWIPNREVRSPLIHARGEELEP